MDSIKMSSTRQQAAEKLVSSLRGKRIEIEDVFQEVPVPRQSHHSSDGKDHTIVLYVRFEETETRYKGLEKERYGSIYFDNLWMSNTDLKTKEVPTELRKFLEQERNDDKVVFFTGMEFNEKQGAPNPADGVHWPWVYGRDIKVVFTLNPDKHQPEKIFKTGIVRKTDRLTGQSGTIWLSYPVNK
jgi:hypothetical protein